jgi:hypothetical protein
VMAALQAYVRDRHPSPEDLDAFCKRFMVPEQRRGDPPPCVLDAEIQHSVRAIVSADTLAPAGKLEDRMMNVLYYLLETARMFVPGARDAIPQPRADDQKSICAFANAIDGLHATNGNQQALLHAMRLLADSLFWPSVATEPPTVRSFVYIGGVSSD